MNRRRLFREFATYKGKEAYEFVEMQRDYYVDRLITKSKSGELEETTIDYQEILYWLIRTKRINNEVV